MVLTDASVTSRGVCFFCALQKREHVARLISERVWHSKKLSNVHPKEWQPEYTWLLPISFVDGTFEADAQDIWARAYAYAREDWDAGKVAKLLDEFERVGLLQRTTDADGRIWGFWVGSDNFLPPPSHRERYKVGKRSLFGNIKDESSSHQGCIKDASLSPPERVPLGVGVVGGCGIGEGEGVGLVCGQDSGNEQEQVKTASAGASSLQTASATSTPPNPDDYSNRLEYSKACRAAGVLPVPRPATCTRERLAEERFNAEMVEHDRQVALNVAAWAAEVSARKGGK